MMKIDVITGSRLHFGLICGTRQSGWQFGGIGMMLRDPSWRISVLTRNSATDQISASAEATVRVAEFLRQIRLTGPLQAIEVKITEEVPFHAGLGGGTQLGLALAAAADLLRNRRVCHDVYHLARIAQRAERSAVGTVGFQDGGFLIDHGLPDESEQSRVVERVPIPEDWRFVFVRPTQVQGLSGDRERRFFSKRIHMPESLVSELQDQIQQHLVPAVRHCRFDEFAMSLEFYGRSVGQFYSTEQGDVFAHPAIRKLVAVLGTEGVRGSAQSSWGPGICIPARSISHAQSIAELVPELVDDVPLTVLISEPLNVGASIRTNAPESAHGQFA